MKKARSPVLIEYLATNLKAVRAAKGLTQEDVADRCDLSVAYISLLERGGRNAPLNTVERIAEAVGVEPHVLLIPPRARPSPSV
jgi:transcriptional regulator with XRE-family HTH domain